MTRQLRALQIGVVVLAALGSSLPAQSAARVAPPALVVRETGTASGNLVTEAAARLGLTRAEVAAPPGPGAVASTGQTVKRVLITVAFVALAFLALALSAL